ncbi:MAG: asparagine synthase (glutamine-hydrolyzing) [Flavobacteriaceae bacterium]
MCGILGYFGNEAIRFSKMSSLERISHRGPDYSNFICKGNSYLGHTRLSIVDLSSNGNQPMISSDGKYAIIFNGEIFNHQELREEYLNHIKFVSTGDTETLLHGLISLGDEFIEKLNGIFAFAFYNFESGDFTIARDHFGVKPLYYYMLNNEICFSSEIKAISDYIPYPTVNKKSLKNYLNFLYSPGEITPLNEIKKLLPGKLIKGNSFSKEKPSIIEYYNLKFNDHLIPKKTEQEWIDLLDSYICKAVERQMMSDVPIGFFLSGGLDSSLIVAVAKKLFPEKKLICYTIRSEDFKKEGFSDDLIYAKKVAEHLKVNLKIIDADVDIISSFDKVVYHLDEPQADPAAINVFNICKGAKQDGIKVLLGGTAGDDLFSGYRRHKALRLENKFEKIPRIFRLVTKKITQSLRTISPLLRRIKKLTANFEKNKSERILAYFDWINSSTLEDLFLEKNNFDHHAFFKSLDKQLPQNTSDLNKMLNWELKTFLVDHNLNYTDKLSMATGLEVRVPFLDRELVEFSTKIPITLKMKGNETKYILKKVAENYLPREVIYRSKTGFGAPVRKWIINDMDSLINSYLSKESIEKRGVFNYDKVKELIENNKLGIIDASYTIWALLAIESWMLQFYDK